MSRRVIQWLNRFPHVDAVLFLQLEAFPRSLLVVLRCDTCHYFVEALLSSLLPWLAFLNRES